MRQRILLLTFTVVLMAACRGVAPATTPSPATTPAATHPAIPLEEMRALMQREDLVRAFASVERDRDAIIAQWRAITEIPAPSGHEDQRADYIQPLLEQYGLTNVHRDSVGNLMGTRKGTGGGKHVVFDAHLDTVFSLGTNLTTRIENGKIYAPGIGDDTRNVIALLAMIRAMNDAGLQTKGDLTFVFTVEEETDFNGVYHFLDDHKGQIDRYVALDGGYTNFTYGGTGIYWHRYHILGAGGHTRSDTPPYSATLPIARSILRLYALNIAEPSWFNIGMLGGADVFNAKAADAWLSVDLRSTNESELKRLDGVIQNIVAEEAKKAGMTWKRDVVSIEEVASMPGHRNSPMVLTTEAIYRAFGIDPGINDTASNHTSAAIRAGIPAVGMGTTPCESSHALEENCEIEPIFTGIKRTITVAMALSE